MVVPPGSRFSPPNTTMRPPGEPRRGDAPAREAHVRQPLPAPPLRVVALGHGEVPRRPARPARRSARRSPRRWCGCAPALGSSGPRASAACGSRSTSIDLSEPVASAPPATYRRSPITAAACAARGVGDERSRRQRLRAGSYSSSAAVALRQAAPGVAAVHVEPSRVNAGGGVVHADRHRAHARPATRADVVALDGGRAVHRAGLEAADHVDRTADPRRRHLAALERRGPQRAPAVAARGIGADARRSDHPCASERGHGAGQQAACQHAQRAAARSRVCSAW